MEGYQSRVVISANVMVNVKSGDRHLNSVTCKAKIMKADLEEVLSEKLKQTYKLVRVGEKSPPENEVEYICLKNGMILQVEEK